MCKKPGPLSVCLFVLGTFVWANVGFAKTWFLPEYMEKIPNTFRQRVNSSDTPIKPASECSRFKDTAGKPLRAPNEIPTGHVCTAYPNAIINKNCVGNCRCDPSKFIYSSSNCSGDYKIGGTLCNDGTVRGTKCLCDTNKYPLVINGTTCKFPDTSAGVCKDKPSNTAHYITCYADTCWKYSNLVDKGSAACKWGCPSTVDANCPKCSASSCYTDDCHLYDDPAVSSCEYGCKQTSSDVCTSKCAECYTDNCRFRPDKRTDLGCEKYWADCPVKCQKGKTCTNRDCRAEGYTQTSCPPHADCGEPCTNPCDDGGTKYYKYGTCNEGFIDLETYWCNGTVKCWWNGTFDGITPVTCSDLGYTIHCETHSCLCGIGEKISYCPSDNSYYKCSLDAAAWCQNNGYTKKFVESDSGLVMVCPVGQTGEKCSKGGYYKCQDTSFSVPCDDYTTCSAVSCRSTDTKVVCPSDETKCQCITPICPSGTFTSNDTAACDCEHGYMLRSVLVRQSLEGKTITIGCYGCGTLSECSSIRSDCMTCRTPSKPVESSCPDQGYTTHCEASGSSGLLSKQCCVCDYGQSVEYCPSDSSYCKCAGSTKPLPVLRPSL